VREPSYGTTFRIVQERLAELRPEWRVERCYWGELNGVKIDGRLRTVPVGRGEGRTRSIASVRIDDAELALTVWQFLYADPFYELRWLASVAGQAVGDAGVPPPPGAISQGRVLHRRIDALDGSSDGDLAEILRVHRLVGAWHRALPLVRDSEELREALATGDQELPSATARSLVAATITAAEEEGTPAVTAETRDRMVDAILQLLGGQPRGIKDWLLAPLKGLASRGVTWYVARDRTGLSEGAAPAAGDVVLYQTRGGGIRQFVADAIAATPGPVYLVAHSLGGVACVDLLVMKRLATVRGLITVGSQSPLLYELDCLTSLRPPAGLPQGFPRWLNLFDPRDFLSYIAEPVFDPDVVKDVEVRSGEPFPQSHSAYWQNDAVWRHIVDFIDEVEQGHEGEPS